MLIITENKIMAIKALRTFAQETFGVVSGLQESKAFVNALQDLQQEYLDKEELNKKLSHLIQGMSTEEINNILNPFGLKAVYL